MKNFVQGTQRGSSANAVRIVYKYRHRFTAIPTPGAIINPNAIEIVVAYSDYSRINRGVSVSVGVIEEQDGCDSRVLLGPPTQSGKTYFATPLNRYNPKLVLAVAERLDNLAPDVAAQWLTDYINADNLMTGWVRGMFEPTQAVSV